MCSLKLPGPRTQLFRKNISVVVSISMKVLISLYFLNGSKQETARVEKVIHDPSSNNYVSGKTAPLSVHKTTQACSDFWKRKMRSITHGGAICKGDPRLLSGRWFNGRASP